MKRGYTKFRFETLKEKEIYVKMLIKGGMSYTTDKNPLVIWVKA